MNIFKILNKAKIFIFSYFISVLLFVCIIVESNQTLSNEKTISDKAISLSCTTDVDFDDEVINQWLNDRNLVDLKNTLQKLNDCSKVANNFQLAVALNLLIKISQNQNPQEKKYILSWLRTKFFINLKNPWKPIEFLNSAQDYLEKQTPLPLDLISELYSYPFKWIDVASAETAVKDKSKFDLIIELLERSSSYFYFTGRINIFRDWIDKNPKFLSNNNKFESKLQIIEPLCVSWIENGQSQKCINILNQLSSDKSLDGILKLKLKIVTARAEYLIGNFSNSIVMSNENLNEAKRIKNTNVMNWSYYGLSNYYVPTLQFELAEKNLQLFDEQLPLLKLGWIEVISMTRHQMIKMLKGECQASIKQGDLAIEFISKNVVGKVSELAWAQLFQLGCFVKLNNNKRSISSYSELSKTIILLPSFGHIQLIADALMDSLNKKDAKKKINELKKIIGSNHPDVVVFEKFIDDLNLKKVSK